MSATAVSRCSAGQSRGVDRVVDRVAAKDLGARHGMNGIGGSTAETPATAPRSLVGEERLEPRGGGARARTVPARAPVRPARTNAPLRRASRVGTVVATSVRMGDADSRSLRSRTKVGRGRRPKRSVGFASPAAAGWLMTALAGAGCFADPTTVDPQQDTSAEDGGTATTSGDTAISGGPDETHGETAVDTDGSTAGTAADTTGDRGSTGGSLEPAGLAVDPEGNGVLDPNEAVQVRPSWTELDGRPGTVAGTLDMFDGPSGPDYAIVDATATFEIAAFDTVSCAGSTPADCYVVEVATLRRPQTHWDATVVETLDSGPSHDWALHVGGSFVDVLPTSRYYAAIESVLHHAIVAGCTSTEFCPAQLTTRAQAAVFVTNARLGPAAPPPTTGTIVGKGDYDCSPGGTSVYDDVAPTSPFCPHIHYLTAEGIASGCTNDPPAFCPAADVTRWQLAVFTARAVSEGPVPPDYVDQDTGRTYDCGAVSPDLHFEDVGAEHPACAHVHYLWARGGEIECATPTTFCPADNATRAHAAQVVTDGHGLALYAP